MPRLRLTLSCGAFCLTLATVIGCQPPQPVPTPSDSALATPASPNTTTDEAIAPSANTTTDEALPPSPNTTGDEVLTPPAAAPEGAAGETPAAPPADNTDQAEKSDKQ